MAYIPEVNDPFSFYGGDKIPSLSWRDLPMGSAFTLEVMEPAKALQSRDYETGDLKFWDAEKTRPVMSAVVSVRVQAGPHSVGEARSIWAQIPSNLFIALKEAQKIAGQRFLSGGILHLRLVGEKPHDNPRMNAIKQYEALYEPPRATEADPFAASPGTPSQTTPTPAPAPAPASQTTAPRRAWR